jgi:hypothetical protein
MNTVDETFRTGWKTRLHSTPVITMSTFHSNVQATSPKYDVMRSGNYLRKSKQCTVHYFLCVLYTNCTKWTHTGDVVSFRPPVCLSASCNSEITPRIRQNLVLVEGGKEGRKVLEVVERTKFWLVSVEYVTYCTRTSNQALLIFSNKAHHSKNLIQIKYKAHLFEQFWI